ncbi:MAG: hypothetical protein AB7G75_29580 [Candidatus Binatia bacterium]
MRTTNMTKSKGSPRSLGEKILSLCATGRFGVREAIATATKTQKQQQKPTQTQERQQEPQASETNDTPVTA